MLRTPPMDGAWNMACDLVFMAVAKADGVGILRVYEWATPTVSFGRHERAVGVYSDESIREAGFDAVRRPTGGRALLHSREVTYSVSMPIADAVSWSTAYGRVNERLLAAMDGMGVPARIVKDANAPVSGANGGASFSETSVCFSGIATGEIAVGDRKLVASSVWRERGSYLQHGSVLLHDDQHQLTRLSGIADLTPQPAAVLSDSLPPETTTEDKVVLTEGALRDAFSDCGKSVTWSIPSSVFQEIAAVRLQLMSPAWLWRR